jgi:hypothetical protein
MALGLGLEWSNFANQAQKN